jgi:4-azaleucine resistance transporter AzlC
MNNTTDLLDATGIPLGRDARHADFRRGLKAALPILIGFMPFALVLGAQAAQKGLSPIEVSLMTGLNFAGGSEFAAIQLWTSPPHILLIMAITFLVNSRHLLMGAALAPLIEHLPRRRALLLLFLMCDESWALGMADARRRAAQGMRQPFSVPFYLATGLSFYLTWVVFTGLGGVLGPLVGDVRTYGFDMAFAAVFLVLLRGMWKGWRPARPWLVSLVVGAATYLLAPPGWHVAAGALSGVLAAWYWAGQA